MKQLDLFWTEIEPLLDGRTDLDKQKISATFQRLKTGISRLETNYTLALANRTAVHALLKKTSEDLIQRYQTIFEYSGTAMVILELDGTISLANSFVEKILGYTREEVENRRFFFDFVHADSREFLKRNHQRRQEGDTTIPNFYETRLLHKDGRLLNVIISAAMLPRTKQSVVSILDITDRKLMEEELVSSRHMLKLVLDTIPERVFWKDRDSVYLGANLPLALDAGYSDPDELIGKTDYDTTFAATAELYRADDRQIMESGLPKLNYEEPQIKPDGSRTWLRTRKVPLRNKDGKVIGILGTYEDITESKRAVEALQESEARFRTLAETSNAAIFVFSQKIIYANPAAEELTGYGKHELLTMDFWDLVHPDFKGLVRDRDLRQQKGELLPPRYEFKIIRKDGTERWINASTSFIQLEGLPDTSISVHIDITEQKLLEEEQEYHRQELQRYAAIMRQTNDKLNLMNNITRHDILNQLTALLGCLEMMEMKFTDPSLQKYIHHEIRSAETIHNLIMFTKDYQDIGIQSPRWFDLKKSILSTAQSLPLPHITLDICFDNLEVYADPLIEKVIYTLFDNALNHGKTVSRIVFSDVVNNGGLVLTCSDNGMGVPTEHKEAIFQRKYFKHTGFGLFLSREILAITGFSIRETGEPGKGARFEITIPPGSFRM